jgi:hypothetical protein
MHTGSAVLAPITKTKLIIASINRKKLASIMKFIFQFLACFFIVNVSLATDYSVTSSTTSAITLTGSSSDTLTVSSGGSINYSGTMAVKKSAGWNGTETYPCSPNTLTNAGTISSTRDTIYAPYTKCFNINNSGTISSSSYQALKFDNSFDDLTITNSGTISSTTYRTINIRDADDVVINNSGTISGTEQVIYAHNTDNLTITNSGAISASAATNGGAIYHSVSGTFKITNTSSGTITSSNNIPIHAYTYNTNAFILDNAGTINGLLGSNLVTSSQTITNSGTLNNNSGSVLYINKNTQSGSVTITNSGTISSTSDSPLALMSDNLTLTNTGTISSTNNDALQNIAYSMEPNQKWKDSIEKTNPSLEVKLYLRLDLGYTFFNEYKESGVAAKTLSYNNHHIKNGSLSFGTTLNKKYKINNGSITPFLRFEGGASKLNNSLTEA